MTNSASSSPLGVCVLPQTPPNAPHTGANAQYLHEILAHAGTPYRILALDELETKLDELRLLVTAGEFALDDATLQRLRAWVQAGGAWLSLGGLCNAGDLLGAEYSAPAYSMAKTRVACTLGEGYLQPAENAHKVLEHLAIPLHFYNGLAVAARDGAHVAALVLDAHGRETARPALIENTLGNGRCLFVAPDAVGAVVHIQQGVAVTADGVPAPDGAGPRSDGVLKSDDGAVLDWYFDRQEVPGAPGLQGFLQPVADQWRELILRAIFYLAETQRVTLPVLWLYPRNLPALAHLSHDTDGNDLALGRRLLEVVNEAKIHSTWCTIPPGYPHEFLQEVAASGHELAMHYNALDRPWSEEEFHEQCRYMSELCGVPLLSNKNHYTRWEGGIEFFEWCERQGIQLDQSKGVSKVGEVGFNFGSCHPYFPLAPDGELRDVLELCLPTQDLEIFAPPAVLLPLLDAVEKHHGVLHLLFHPAHIAKPGVAQAISDAVAAAQQRGLEWWTALQINNWERARRRIRWERIQADKNRCEVSVSSAQSLPDATLLFLGAPPRLTVNGQERDSRTTTRWGFEFQAVTLDVGDANQDAVA